MEFYLLIKLCLALAQDFLMESADIKKEIHGKTAIFDRLHQLSVTQPLLHLTLE